MLIQVVDEFISFVDILLYMIKVMQIKITGLMFGTLFVSKWESCQRKKEKSLENQVTKMKMDSDKKIPPASLEALF